MVVILGAGSSADFGVPTLRNIFKDTQARRYLATENPDLLDMLRETFWHPRGFDLDTSDKSLTVEEMLTILRDWEEGHPPGPPDPEQFRKGLNCLIERAVFAGKSSRGRHLNELIGFCGRTFERTTWASFNWDALFESSFWYSSDVPGAVGGHRRNPRLVIEVADYRFTTSAHELLKLHGAINWWMVDDVLTYFRWGGGGSLQPKWDEYCRAADPRDYPVILEPSAHKYRLHPYPLLEPQWYAFLDRLLSADCVLIVGYSLPAGDSEARSKILTAFQVNRECQWGVIDNNIEVCGLYQRLLGEGRLRCANTTLVGFNNDIEANLSALFPGVRFVAPPAPPTGTA